MAERCGARRRAAGSRFPWQRPLAAVRVSVCPCVGGGFEASGAPPPDLLAAECNFRALPWKLPWLLVGEARGCVVLRGGDRREGTERAERGGWGGVRR